MNDRTAPILRRALRALQGFGVFVSCATVSCFVGCRQESPTGTSAAPEVSRVETVDDPPSPIVETVDDPPSPIVETERAVYEPPRAATVTILSAIPIPEGTIDIEGEFATMVEGGIVGWTSEDSDADASRPDPKTRATKNRKPLGNPLEGIEQELISKWNSIQSLSSKMESHYYRKTEDYEITTEGAGTRDYSRVDGQVRLRSKFGTGIKIVVETEEIPTRQTGQRVLKVFDGKHLYVEVETHEGKKVTKSWATPGSFMAVGGPGLILVLRGMRKFSRAPDTRRGSRSMYVFTGYKPDTVSIKYVVEKETGLLYSVERKWKGSDRTRSLKFVAHDINPSFPEDHFTYTAPEDVQVEDLTQSTEVPQVTVPRP